jgi:hypothetical protein
MVKYEWKNVLVLSLVENRGGGGDGENGLGL